MLGRQAKMLSPRALNRALAHVRHTASAERDTVIILLSARAGLRACEIAHLTWGMLLNPHGRVGSMIEIRASISRARTHNQKLTVAAMQIAARKLAAFRS